MHENRDFFYNTHLQLTTYNLPPPAMPTPRRPLGPINGNSIRKELTPYKRGQITGGVESGQTPAEIARALNIPDATVRSTISRDPLRNEGHSRPRSGRPKKYSDRDELPILRFVRNNPKATYEGIRQVNSIELSHTTLKRIFRNNNITSWCAKKRPALSQAHADARLAWALARMHWAAEQWSNIMWSDGCVQLNAGTGKSQV